MNAIFTPVRVLAMVVVGSFGLSMATASAAPLYWSPGANPNAGGGGLWTTAGNWSTTPGGTKAPSGTAPTISDDVFFGGTAGTVTTGAEIFANSLRVDTDDYSLSHATATRTLQLNNFAQTDQLKKFVITHSRTSAATWVLDVIGNTAFDGIFRNNTTGNHALSVTVQSTGRFDLRSADFQNTGSTSILRGTLVVRGASSGLGVIPSAGALQIGQAGANSTAILEIDGGGSASSFTRALGSSAGQVRLGSGVASEGNNATGFSALNGDLTVNFGGDNSVFSWTTGTNFIRTDTLILSASTSTHRTIFANPISFSTLLTDRTVRVGNGSAAIDAEINQAISTTTADRVLIKDGAGTLLLSGTSAAFAGRLNVAEGSLLVTGAITSSTNNATYGVNVAAGATLGGTGTITLSNPAASVIVSGAIAPGNSIGTLTINSDVTWNYNTDSEWVFELGSSGASILSPGVSDLLAIDGDFLKGSGSGFTFDFAGTGAAGWYQLVSWTGTGASFNDNDFLATNLSGSLSGNFHVETTGLYLEVIPEPSTALLIVLGMGAVFLRRKLA